MKEELYTIIYENSLGHIKEAIESLRLNKEKSYKLGTISFIAMAILLQEINFQKGRDIIFSCEGIIFWLGILFWVTSLVISLFINRTSTSIEYAYFSPDKLLIDEFINQEKSQALEGLSIKNGEGAKEIFKKSDSVAKRNDFATASFFISFILLFIHVIFF